MTLSPYAYTATMARLFADQGYLRKAAEIYRHLADQHPEREDLRQALATLERQLAEQAAPSRKDAELLLREWIDLLKQAKQRERDKSH